MRATTFLVLLLIALTSAVACSGGDKPISYTGNLPPIVEVTYQNLDGDLITTQAFDGWVTVIYVRDTAKLSTVRKDIQEFGGTVIDGLPSAGVYTVAVPSDSVAALIDKFNEDMMVEDAIPAVTLAEADVSAIDFPFNAAEPGTGKACTDFHGDLTSSQISQAGSKVKLVDARPSSAIKAKLRHPWMTFTGAQLYEELKSGQVVNLSLQGDSKLSAGAYYHAEVVFLTSIFAVAESAPDGLVVVAAGNGGADNKGDNLTPDLERLRRQFPKAAKRVVVVEAKDQNGKRADWSNYSTNGTTVAAPGVDIPMETEVTSATGARVPVKITCSGTSFAAPIVAAILDAMKKASPSSSAADITDTFYAVTKETGGVPYDWNAGPFMARLIQALQQRKPTPTVSVPKDTDGKGSVTITSVSCRLDDRDPFDVHYVLIADGTVSGPVGAILQPDIGDVSFFNQTQAGWKEPGVRAPDVARGPNDPETTTWHVETVGVEPPFTASVSVFLPDNKGSQTVERKIECP